MQSPEDDHASFHPEPQLKLPEPHSKSSVDIVVASPNVAIIINIPKNNNTRVIFFFFFLKKSSIKISIVLESIIAFSSQYF